MPRRAFPGTGLRRAFSLIELLTVMAIIVILMSLTIPAFDRMTRSSNLATAGQMMVDALNLARQTAVARNREVEVRFYQLPASIGTGQACRAMQVFVIDPTANDPRKALNPVTRVIRFPEPVIMTDSTGSLPNPSARTSTILRRNSDPTNRWSLPDVGENYQYSSFKFTPMGETDLPPPISRDEEWLATLVIPSDETAESGLPKNYFTARIDFTGKISVFRP